MKIGGVILILIGIMTFTGWMNGISKYLNKISQPLGSKQEEQNEDTISDKEISKDDNSNDDNSPNNTSEEKEKFPAIDFTLKDQYGNEHTLSDYKGKVVFLNFWATWCNPCLREMPDIEKIYKQYGKNQEEVIILAVANPSSDEYPNNADVSKDEIIAFLDENGYTFPVVFDETGNLLSEYLISAFPTTFLIDKEGNISGYAPGMLTKDMMDNVIEQTLNSTQ